MESSHFTIVHLLMRNVRESAIISSSVTNARSKIVEITFLQ